MSVKSWKMTFLSFRRKPESRNNNRFWTPATLSRRKPGAGVTALRHSNEIVNIEL